MKRQRIFEITTGVLFVFFLSACASTPAPKEELTRAESAIKQAEQAGATEYAALELREAKARYDEANQIVETKKDNDYPRARQLAQQAIADAELAAALARAKRAETLSGEVREGLETLKQELDRPPGAAQ